MNSTGNRGLITGFAMVFATLLVTAVLGYLNVRRLYHYDRLVDHTHQVVSEMRNLLAILADAESGMRGFVITQDEAYLRPYETAKVTAPAALKRIGRMTADNVSQQANITELESLIARRMDLMTITVDAARRHGYEQGKEEVARGMGRAAMERVREKIHGMEREEDALLNKRVGEAVVGYWTAVVTSLISAIIGLSLALFGLYLSSRDVKARELRAKELNEINTRLEQRVVERTAAISTTNAALREEISERQRAEELTRQMAGELERSNRELSQFATVASHDLQEPLRKIQAFGDRLLGQCGDELSVKGRDYLDRMLKSTGRMRELIDSLLEYSRVSTRSRPNGPVDLQDVALEVVGDLEPRLMATGGKVEIGPLPTIAADRMQMRQLFQNLIGNALKFQRPGTTPHVQVSARLLQADHQQATNGSPALACELEFEDNGIGFEPVYAERIFELFQRLHGRSEYEGTGMGLAICKKIAERHGGTIHATSTPGVGSRFLVKLPISEAPALDDAASELGKSELGQGN
jgi:signal transduction histidine kinase